MKRMTTFIYYFIHRLGQAHSPGKVSPCRPDLLSRSKAWAKRRSLNSSRLRPALAASSSRLSLLPMSSASSAMLSRLSSVSSASSRDWQKGRTTRRKSSKGGTVSTSCTVLPLNFFASLSDCVYSSPHGLAAKRGGQLKSQVKGHSRSWVIILNVLPYTSMYIHSLAKRNELC